MSLVSGRKSSLQRNDEADTLKRLNVVDRLIITRIANCHRNSTRIHLSCTSGGRVKVSSCRNR
jgi:hypothetical protein